jgi:chromosomal replication initiation ATPase DnaA
VLDLPVEEGLGRSDFLPAASNRTALAMVEAWPAWPAPVLVLHGAAGSGKSHLARIWATTTHALLLDAAAFTGDGGPVVMLGGRRAAVVEHADRVSDEAELFHLHNALVGRGGHLLLTTRQSLAAWAPQLPDLRSRLRAAAWVTIEPPDDGLLAALLVKQLGDRQLVVEPGVVEFLLARMERSCAAARRMAKLLDQLSLALRRPITTRLASQALELAHASHQDSDQEGQPWISA